jgi:hypothetical protein
MKTKDSTVCVMLSIVVIQKMIGVLVRFSITVTKTQEKQIKTKDLIWLMVSEVLVHHGGKDMMLQSSSHNGVHEAERMPVLKSFLLFTLLFHPGPYTTGCCFSHIEWVLPQLVNPL